MNQGFIGAAMPTNINVVADKRHVDAFFWRERIIGAAVLSNMFVPDEDPLFQANMATPWWPCGGFLIADTGMSDIMEATAWLDMYPVSGANSRFGYVDIARDVNGNPIPGATVRCFVASSGEMTASVITDVNGYFIVTTPYYVTHFLTVHKAGAPNLAGASAELLPPV